MHITVEEFKRAGKIANQVKFTNEELQLLITVTKLSLAYLEGRKPHYELATTPLRQDLEQLIGYARCRKMRGYT